MREEIRRAFSPLHASQSTLEEVLKMAETKKEPQNITPKKIVRTVLIAAVLTAALLTLTAFTVDYVLNHREIFFFDSLEALTQQQSEDHPDAAASYAVPGTAEESKDVETPSEYVSRAMEQGLLENETLLSQKEGDYSRDGWERQVIRSSEDSFYGNVVTEYRTAGDYAQKMVVEDLLDWDLTFLAEKMTPMDGGQIAVLCRSEKDGQLLWVKTHLGYIPREGSRFSLSYEYNTFFDSGEDPEYILNSSYDWSEVFVTQDNVEVLIQEYDGQIWCSAVNRYKTVSIYATGCTFEEMKDILNQLDLRTVLI